MPPDSTLPAPDAKSRSLLLPHVLGLATVDCMELIHAIPATIIPDETEEAFVEQKVTYSLEVEGRFIVVEHVPARVSLRTGERFFAAETVERLQEVVWGQRVPKRVIQTPVYEFPSAVA